MLTRAASFAGLFGLLALLLAPGAGADPVTCEVRDPRTGICLIEIQLPPEVSPIPDPGPGEESSSGSEASAPRCQSKAGIEVPCTDLEYGTWSNDRSCYIGIADPQPPYSDPAWDGKTDGSIYHCLLPPELSAGTGFGFAGRGFGFSVYFWSATPPNGPTLTSEQAAEIVVAGMDLRAIDIGIVPEPGAASVGLVGLPVWMWTEQTPNTWGPISRTATAGGVTITATANVQRVVWDMGDGTSVTCTTPGTIYQDHYGDQTSPDCGHKYTETSVGHPGDAYPVTATNYWIVDWNGGGDSGQIPLELTAQIRIQVGELQVLVTR